VRFKQWISTTLLAVCVCSEAAGQSTPQSVAEVLARPIQSTAVTAYQVQRFLMASIPKLQTPTTARQWSQEALRLRQHYLDDIIFHGWPRQWVDSSPRFEEVRVIETQHGYRLRLLRYQIVPGFWSAAVLYEPDRLKGKAPAILNVHGHEPMGMAAEYKQKRCINFAKRGILALSLEWFGFGQLSQAENAHDYGAHLDLAGANALGLFYLAMRQGLDYLAALPEADPQRLGVTGLSGGGWQTIVLSALDPRVKVAVEVAGFGSLQTNITHPVDTDEVEEDAADFCKGMDYTTLVALRAPRPTMLVHNANDNCCFRSMLVKPYIYTAMKPFFELYGKGGNLAWHENRDPGTHNYQLDNRQTAYGFFTQHFGMPVTPKEIPSAQEIKRPQELEVSLPADNLTVLGLARQFAAAITRPPVPANSEPGSKWATSERETLASVLRYQPVKVANAWRIWNTKGMGIETLSYRFDFTNGLSAVGVWLKAIDATDGAPAVIILSDKGRKAAANLVSDCINRGNQALALDLIFNGEMRPQKPNPTDYELLANTTGHRPLGLETEQLVAAARWLAAVSGNVKVSVLSEGMRSQLVALNAAALEPSLFTTVETRSGIQSLGYLFSAPVPLRKAPELFCLDYYKDFDVDRLIMLAQPVHVIQSSTAGSSAK
jgi:dienelactone hydrolase